MNMMRFCIALSFIVISSLSGFAQGTIKGRITDTNGELLIGVSIYLKDNPSIGVAADIDGLYALHVPSGMAHIVIVNFVSYQPILDTVIVHDGETIVKDYVLIPEAVKLGEVEVVARHERRNQYFMDMLKRNSASSIDYMSGDLMSKTGDNNVSSAISRVTGVATNGSFITVRGLGDRYVQTCINGSLIPTLDPFTNNIKLDLFPSSFVDNIIITKTSSPNFQADWSAAYISIETKDNPDRLAIAIETKVGYNPQTSFKNVIINEASSTDWLGFDNGFRDIDHENYSRVIDSPTSYQEMCALGLESFYRSLGITESWDPATNAGQTYFKLGLIQLGLLGKAFIDDDQAVREATEAYNAGAYRNEAFKVLNKKPEAALNDFANNWNTFKKKAPLNLSQSFSIGNQTKIFGKPLSFLLGFRYGNSIQYDPQAQLTRTITSDLDSMGNPYFIQHYKQKLSKNTSGWTGLGTALLKINKHHQVSLLFMPNLLGVNSIREGIDQVGSTSYRYAFLNGQFYEERAQFLYQYKSEHFLPSVKAKIHLSASFADGSSSAPDFKTLQYFSEDSIHYTLDKTISNVRRNFRYLDENIFDVKTSVELPLWEKAGFISKFVFGGSYTGKQREAIQYDYLLQQARGVAIGFTDGNLNELFADEKFDIRKDPVSGEERIDLYYRKFDDPANHTIGHTKITSGFVMIDQSLNEKIRINAGIRAERARIFTDIKLFHELGYAPDDLRRKTPEQSFILTPSDFDQIDFLPSANMIYHLRDDDMAPANLRISYGRSVARPSIREYTESIVRDFELNDDVFGNADLRFVHIDNYDIRYENYLPNENFYSVSLFYKNFINHIELTSSNFGFTWSNADKSNVYGIELEGRIKLGTAWELRSNISAVKSYTRIEDRRLSIENGVKSWIVLGHIERTMFGQAPYVVNMILNYKSENGFSGNLSYNVQGAKLVLTSVDSSPDIYEMPRHLLNIKLGQTIGKHYAISLTIRDLFNDPVKRSYKYEGGYLLDFDRYRFGSDYTIGMSYNL